MRDRYPELLAPAGNFEAFTGAVNAGADAVYLAGKQFGARAFAENFSDEEIIKAIDYAHLNGKKIYMTVNTLLKQNEIEVLPQYLKPFYEEGLDAVIIQDMGALFVIQNNFPDLECHASTQMTITSSEGALFAKQFGITRVVPARELSLDELIAVKKESGLQLETFIHGSMCYCYSGQCLMSSIIGGRSGNRGQCAQPCRLPYQTVNKHKDNYPLSMKDMCTAGLIEQLIAAGIDSFKIEGRMKKAEYAAAVTSVYRNLIDRILSGKPGTLTGEEKSILSTFYIRSSVMDGYYHKYNGKEMITLTSPAYSKTEEMKTRSVRTQYIECDLPRLQMEGKVELHVNQPSKVTVSMGTSSFSVEGSVTEEARKAPLDRQSVEKQMQKTKDTFFEFSHLSIDLDENVFITVSELNKLRRDALTGLKEVVLEEKNGPNHTFQINHDYSTAFEKEDKEKFFQKDSGGTIKVSLKTTDQYQVIKKYDVDLIFPFEWIFHQDKWNDIMTEKQRGRSVFIQFPPILREALKKDTEEAAERLRQLSPDGFYIGQNDQIEWMRTLFDEVPLYGLPSLYCMNDSAAKVYLSQLRAYGVPYEMNAAQMRDLFEKERAELTIYGYLPLMISVNCVRKTLSECKKSGSEGERKEDKIELIDRYQNHFPTEQNCRYCMNTIYNCVPLSLHKELSKIERIGIRTKILSFTMENGDETDAVMKCFLKRDEKRMMDDALRYTCGHFNRGV